VAKGMGAGQVAAAALFVFGASSRWKQCGVVITFSSPMLQVVPSKSIRPLGWIWLSAAPPTPRVLWDDHGLMRTLPDSSMSKLTVWGPSILTMMPDSSGLEYFMGTV
jgi:hypothetical protein